MFLKIFNKTAITKYSNTENNNSLGILMVSFEPKRIVIIRVYCILIVFQSFKPKSTATTGGYCILIGSTYTHFSKTNSTVCSLSSS